MRLNRLELQGFKSFVDPTVIDFNLPIIGIVGPNGCGKSNVVDAIRWVMGEMSAKHLRGKAMEDVIFSGSSNRAPTGMASVSLTFATSDGMVPPQYSEFSEITVTRKLFRSGESEYLINKIPCRLRDILDLFLGTGAGTKAYSVIEQGQVDFAINAKPEDRRRLIEEAAGISKFKARRDAALRRMDSTQQNLLRLSDILAEIRRQIRSLERQAKKAERYRVLSDELRQLDLHLSAKKHLELAREETELQQLLKQWQEKEEDNQSTLSSSETDLEKQRLEITEQERALSQLQEKIFEVSNRLQLAQTQQQYKSQEITNLKEQSQRWREEAQDARERLGPVVTELNTKEADAVSIDEMTRGAQEQMTTAQTSWEQTQDERRSQTEQLEQCRNEISELASAQASLQSQLEALEQQRPNLLTRIQRLETETNNLQTQHATITTALQGTREEFSCVQSNGQQVESRRIELSQTLSDGQRTCEERQQELSSLQEELVAKRSRLRSLMELQRNLEGYGAGARSILKERQQHEGVHGLVADLVETPPTYEAALVAALGDRMQHIVVEKPEVGRDAIAFLKKEATGRSTFIPKQVRGTSHPPLTEGNGILGPLLEFVTVKTGFDELAAYLFGNTLLVENLDQAHKLWQEGERSYRLVTLEGDLVEPSGVISGGRHESDDSNLIAKRREIDALKQDVVKLEQAIGLHEDTVSQLEGSLSGIDLEAKDLEQEWQGIEVKKASLSKDLAHQEESQQQLDEQLTASKASLAELQNELQGSEATATSAREQMRTNEQCHTERTQDRERLETFIAEIENTLSTRSESLAEAKIKMSSVQERAEAFHKELERLTQSKAELNQRITERETDLDAAKYKVQQLTEEIGGLTEKISQYQEKSDVLKKEQAESQELFNRDRTTQQEAELQLRSIRKELDLAREHTSDLKVALTRLEADIQHLTAQITERYSVSLPDVANEWVEKIPENCEDPEGRASELRGKIERLGNVNLGAIPEFEELKEREAFLTQQHEDLENSLQNLDKVIKKINQTTKTRFDETFKQVQEKFTQVFPRLFKGGRAELRLDDENDLLNTGVQIMVQPPGKRLSHVSLLSGGEKALSAVSFIFAIFLVKPSPFCILDEVDAPLDDANTGRFLQLIQEMTHRTQFILITHNKMTMEMTEALYGVTMEEPGVSKVVSVKLDTHEDLPRAASA